MAKQNIGVSTKPPLKALAKDLRDTDKSLARGLGREHKRLGKIITDDSKSNASQLGGVHDKASGGIKPSASATEIKVIVDAGGAYPMALVAFFGAKAYTGWYGKPQYFDSPPQHPEWIGADWDPTEGDGPYAIGDAVRDNLDDVLEAELDVLEQAFTDAFDNNNTRG